MAVSGKFPSGAEFRRKARRQFNYNARILTGGSRPLPCLIADISASGARLLLDGEEDIPDRFVLLLTPAGGARRHCRVVWRRELTIGVEFLAVKL
jgi:hypothetical protein